jgi:uncharacterized damage-inducible protein DinB
MRSALGSPRKTPAAPLPGSPPMTISGLVSHLRRVEYSWLEVVLLDGEARGPWTKEDPDREMRIGLRVLIPQAAHQRRLRGRPG